MRKAALLYTFGRFGLFLLLAIILWTGSKLVGHELNGLPLLLASALLSSALGYVLFARQRAELAEAIAGRRQVKTDETTQLRSRLDHED